MALAFPHGCIFFLALPNVLRLSHNKRSNRNNALRTVPPECKKKMQEPVSVLHLFRLGFPW